MHEQSKNDLETISTRDVAHVTGAAGSGVDLSYSAYRSESGDLYRWLVDERGNPISGQMVKIVDGFNPKNW